MKRHLLFILITILSINCYSQISFEKGYFINNSGQRTDCLIKNIDWLNNPTDFRYKLTEDEEPKIATIDSVKEFGIINTSKFKRFKVKIDQSNDNIGQLTKSKKPIFTEETIFLKTIIEGNASLYITSKQKRYFYNVNNSEVTQLIYKKYIKQNNEVGTNTTFKSQLWKDLNCSEITIEDIKNTDYKLDDLIKFFEKFNNCIASESINYTMKKKRDAFNFSIKSGVRYSSLSIENASANKYIDFESDLKSSIGLEVELIFPFNKNKWALIFEPTYQSYKAKDTHPVYTIEANYSSIELPLGIKYNMFLNEKSKFFLTGTIVIVDIPFNSNVGNLDVNTTNNVNLGIGYNYNKCSIEFRYGSKRQIISNYAMYSSDYHSLSLLIGYKLF
jgi:hypothetical protein